MLEIQPLFDATLLADATGAFVNVLTWASGSEEFQKKSQELMDSLHMRLIAIENAEPLANRGPEENRDAEFAALVREVRINPKAIRYWAFHTWSEGARTSIGEGEYRLSLVPQNLQRLLPECPITSQPPRSHRQQRSSANRR